jgi:hypothetical protein
MSATCPAHLILLDFITLIKFSEVHDGVSKSFWPGRLERELEMVQLSATWCSCIAILWVSLVSFVATTRVLLLNEQYQT